MVLVAEGTEAWRIEWQDEFDGPKINDGISFVAEGCSIQTVRSRDSLPPARTSAIKYIER